MVKVLVTGEKGYIGTQLKKWFDQKETDYQVDFLPVRDEQWKMYSFEQYDIIIHAAGIAHQKVTEENKQLYHYVNCRLTGELAKKALQEGVSQFIFLSSMSVFGENNRRKKIIRITANTTPNPSTEYGKSKLDGESELHKLRTGPMKIAIIRPPMVYGKGAKGNYNLLKSIALKLPILPIISNERSMIYIDNLCEFIYLTIKHQKSGVFHPQNAQYVSTTQMMQQIVKANHRKKLFTRLMIPFIVMLRNISNKAVKAFGTMTYDMDMSDEFDFSYCITEFDESIITTEMD